MLVLVATSEGQGDVEGDYCWTLDGELVLTGALLECDAPERCGCGRGFAGLGSNRATTTAMVVDRPGIDIHRLRILVRDSLDRQGWLRECDEAEIEGLVAEEVHLISRVTRAFPCGAVVSRSGTAVWQRRAAA